MLKKNDTVPPITLKNQHGAEVSLDQYKGKPVIIYFYPKDETPGCTMEACSFRDDYEDFKEAGAEVIGISSDSVASHEQFAKRHRLEFQLLSDPHKVAQKKFGVPTGLFGLIPGRVTFVADKEGIIQHVFNSQLQPKKHVKEALSVLERMKK